MNHYRLDLLKTQRQHAWNSLTQSLKAKQDARNDLMGRSKQKLMSKTNLGHWNTHAVFKNTPKKMELEMKHPTLSLTRITHSHTETDTSPWQLIKEQLVCKKKQLMNNLDGQQEMNLQGEKKKSLNELRNLNRTRKRRV